MGKSEKNITIHTRRTMMFEELSKVMDYSIKGNEHIDALHENVIGKTSGYNKLYTNQLLVKLYSFNRTDSDFQFFEYFWGLTDKIEKPLLTLLFALQTDFLLSESISVVLSTPLNEKVTIERFEENIELMHPGNYTLKTLKSTAQNIASSWKQAGFILGKVKNIRTQPTITYNVVSFAFLLAYLNGFRGDFIMTSKWAKALCLGDTQLRELAVEAAKRDLLQYQYAGSVTAISFNNLFNKLGINGI